MPQSLANVLLHVVFSTKNRAPYLKDPAIQNELNGYMVGALQGIECPSLIVRSVEDHLHGLVQLSRTVTVAKLIETMSSMSATSGIDARNLAPLGLFVFFDVETQG
jgi:putative transposase